MNTQTVDALRKLFDASFEYAGNFGADEYACIDNRSKLWAAIKLLVEENEFSLPMEPTIAMAEHGSSVTGYEISQDMAARVWRQMATLYMASTILKD